MSSLFFVLIMAAVLAYGIQTPLLSAYARKYDAVTIAIYRNVGLSITMSPVLLFVPEGAFRNIGAYSMQFAIMGLLGAIAFIVGLTSMTYLPVGISQAFRQASNILGALFLGALFFAEYLSVKELMFIALLLSGTIALALSKPAVLHLERQNIALGVWFSVAAGLASACTFLFFSFVSRSISPLVTGYFLELGVAVGAIAFGLLRYVFLRERTPLLSLSDTAKITAISLTTIIGTLSFGYAVTMDTFALASALLSTGGVVALIVAWKFFGERHTRKQVYIIIFILAVVMALQLFR